MKIEHIALYVKDLEKAKYFFTHYFNATSNELYHNINTQFSSYFLTFENGARLEIMNSPRIVNSSLENSMGYSHIAFSVGSKEKVESLTQRLKNDGYKVLSGPRTTGDGYYESCVVGIEGNLVEITI